MGAGSSGEIADVVSGVGVGSAVGGDVGSGAGAVSGGTGNESAEGAGSGEGDGAGAGAGDGDGDGDGDASGDGDADGCMSSDSFGLYFSSCLSSRSSSGPSFSSSSILSRLSEGVAGTVFGSGKAS